jgi:dynein heavy chain
MRFAGKFMKLIAEKFSNLLFHRLSEFEAFKGLHESIEKNLRGWEDYYNSDTPNKMPLPKPWDKLNDFHKMLVLRCFRSDKLVPAIQDYVKCKF